MPKTNKDIVVKSQVTKKEFSFSKNDCNLNFTLRTDIKQQMKDFRDLLVEATEVLDKEITPNGRVTAC